MKINVKTIVSRLEFRFPFRIAHGERTGTDVVFVRLECAGQVSWGEATLPPYLPDKVEDVMRFFNSPVVQNLDARSDPRLVFDDLDSLIPSNMPAKAALDMALWQLKSKMENKSIQEILGIKSDRIVPHTYTIGVGNAEEMKQKMDFGLSQGFSFFKLKLDGMSDQTTIENYLDLSKIPFAVDANQAWRSLDEAVEMSNYLAQNGCVLIEQPFSKHEDDKSKILKKISSIPVIADESCQRLSDISRIQDSFHGINIKLQKCGGITEAFRMIQEARRLGLKVLVGCMSESSVGCSAAEVLAPLCDWADLDGPFLNRNNDQLIETLK